MREKKEHPHAWFFRALADGESAENFEIFSKVNGTLWLCCKESGGAAITSPDNVLIRRKRKMMTLNGFTFPEPVREPLEDGQECWLVNPASGAPMKQTWCGTETERWWLSDGLIQLTREDAEAQRAAMLAPFLKGEE